LKCFEQVAEAISNNFKFERQWKVLRRKKKRCDE